MRRTADLNKVAFIIPHSFGSAFYKILNFRLWCSLPVKVCSGSPSHPGLHCGIVAYETIVKTLREFSCLYLCGSLSAVALNPLCPRRAVPVGANIAGLDQKVQDHQAHD